MSLSKNTQQSKGNEPTLDPAISTKLPNNLVVRIDQDSNDNLQALFDSVLNPSDSKRPLQVPFRMRKLPSSFFNPPSANSRSSTTAHSRTNSADSAYDAGSQSSVNQPSAIGPAIDSQKSSSTPISSQQQSDTNRVTIYHSRAHSSPASLQQSYSIHTNSISERNASPPAESTSFVGSIFNPSINISSSLNPESDRRSSGAKPTIGAPAFHMKQRSYDVISPIQLFNELGALPPGWEQARTNDGQIYYLNHLTKTTQWEDPRVQIKENQQRNFQPTLNQNDITSLSNNLGPLPEGWEQALTESGDVYFINHVNRTTSWNDPRIPEFLQKPVKMTKPEMHWITSPELEKEATVVKHKMDQHSLNRGGNIHMDPFLSGDNHTRQESSDSGLSLSSNTFSLNTDFISQIDESMDCISESGLNGLDCPEHLVSSLQLEDNICNEIFDDVQNILNSPTPKQDNLEWYKIN